MKRYVKRQYGGNMVKHCGAFIQHKQWPRNNSVCGASQNFQFLSIFEDNDVSIQNKRENFLKNDPFKARYIHLIILNSAK